MARVLYMIIFYVIYGLTDLLLLAIGLVQLMLKLFSGEPSQSLKELGASLGIYVKQISEFLSYASEVKPFPFSDWPVSSLKSESEEDLMSR